MEIVDTFHIRFLASDNFNPITFFKDMHSDELHKNLKELKQQKEIFSKITDDIDRFIGYGHKYLEKYEAILNPVRKFSNDSIMQTKSAFYSANMNLKESYVSEHK